MESVTIITSPNHDQLPSRLASLPGSNVAPIALLVALVFEQPRRARLYQVLSPRITSTNDSQP